MAFDETALAYRDLDRAPSAVADQLALAGKLGDRCLLLYPFGPEFMVSFLGFLYAGMIAVPTPLPGRYRHERRRIHSIALDSGAVLARLLHEWCGVRGGDEESACPVGETGLVEGSGSPKGRHFPREGYNAGVAGGHHGWFGCGLARRDGFVARVADRTGLTSRRGGHDPGRVAVDLAVAIADDGEVISDLRTLSDQEVLHGRVALSATAWRLLDGIDEDTLEGLRRARVAARERAWMARGELVGTELPGSGCRCHDRACGDRHRCHAGRSPF